MLWWLAFHTLPVFFGKDSGNFGTYAFASNLNLYSWAFALFVDFNEWMTAHTIASLELSILLFRAETLAFLLIPDKRCLADTLVTIAPFSRLLAFMAFVVEPSVGRFAKFTLVTSRVVVAVFIADTLVSGFIQHKMLVFTAGFELLVLLLTVSSGCR